MTPQPSAASEFRCLGARCDHEELYDCQEAFALALDAAHRDAIQDDALTHANDLVAQYQDGKRDGARETWEAVATRIEQRVKSILTGQRTYHVEHAAFELARMAEELRARAAAPATEAPHDNHG